MGDKNFEIRDLRRVLFYMFIKALVAKNLKSTSTHFNVESEIGPRDGRPKIPNP